jgi:hypothetical protein
MLSERNGEEAGFAPPQGAEGQRPGQSPDEDDAEMSEPEVVGGEGEVDVSASVSEPEVTPTPEPATAADDQPLTAPEPPTATPEDDAEAAAEAEGAAEPEVDEETVTEEGTTDEVMADQGTVTASEATTAASVVVDEPAVEVSAVQTIANTAPPAALVQVEDTNPGPPFSVEISLNRAEPNPLLDGTMIYKVTGLLRNDGDEVYAVNAVNFTFYDADGFRGAFYRFPDRRYGEWIPHGAMKADFDCMLLAPGEVCPFQAEIAAYDMGSFYIHADAVVAEWRESVPVSVQNTTLVDQGSNVRIRGTIVNNNTYAIKNVVVCGALVDGNGQMTSIGSDYYVQPIAAGASVAFDVLIPADTYVTYRLFVQAEGDFK